MKTKAWRQAVLAAVEGRHDLVSLPTEDESEAWVCMDCEDVEVIRGQCGTLDAKLDYHEAETMLRAALPFLEEHLGGGE